MVTNLETARPRVPFGVWVVAILEVLLATLLFLDATGVRPSNNASIVATLGGQGDAIAWFLAGAAVVGVIAAISLARLRTFGLVATTLLAGAGLLNDLGSRLDGHADDVRLAILVVIVLYLNQPAVRAAFRTGDPEGRPPTPRGAEGE